MIDSQALPLEFSFFFGVSLLWKELRSLTGGAVVPFCFAALCSLIVCIFGEVWLRLSILAML